MSPRRGRAGRTQQGEQTRQRIYEAALALFQEQGFEATTNRAVAQAAGVSMSQLYRYFPSKQSVVVALYTELCVAFARSTAHLPDGTWPDRFHHALSESLATLQPHRPTLVGVLPALLMDRDEGLLSPSTAESRRLVMGVFADVVEGSSKPPGDPQPLGRLLYLLQLGVVLWWILDRSEEQRATRELVELLRKMGPSVSMALWLPGVRGRLRRLDQLVREGLYGEPRS